MATKTVNPRVKTAVVKVPPPPLPTFEADRRQHSRHGEGDIEHQTSDRSNAYALRVRGDSMHPRFRAGEYIMVEPGIRPQKDDDVIVTCKDGRQLLRQLHRLLGDEIQLVSVNDGYSPMMLQLSEIQSIRLVTGRIRRSGALCDRSAGIA